VSIEPEEFTVFRTALGALSRPGCGKALRAPLAFTRALTLSRAPTPFSKPRLKLSGRCSAARGSR
jgi:hypothetical protein